MASAKELAGHMAGKAKIIRALIVGVFEHEKERGWLHKWFDDFRKALIPDLKEDEFADMLAQTMAYGLFAAKVHAPLGEPFSRKLAAFDLPKSYPFLRKLFAEIAGVDMPDSIAWAVDDVVELLAHAKMAEILEHFGEGKSGVEKDPVVYFYETFLGEYDPKMRELRGVYYTPVPVADYIVRSIDYLLKTAFGRKKGLADTKTLILDPAVGTATFPYLVIEHIHQRFAKQAGAWDDYVDEHLLERLFGFELLMAPYTVAHLKLGKQLQETGYKFSSGRRLGIYLTNTLEEAAAKSDYLIDNFVAEEANAAAKVKGSTILVVLGNPPYSGHSANRSEVTVRIPMGQGYTAETKRGPVQRTAKKPMRVKQKTFIGRLIEDYKEGCPELHKPAQAKWLHDDYVKFIRFAQWRVTKTGEGIVGLITNHAYLDNPTFRGMRQSLIRNFNQIYIYDLHGNSKKKEQAPDGREDENVFDIQQGVAIMLCVKEKGNTQPARVYHADLWGTRKDKYDCLSETDVSGTSWKELEPSQPHYLFVSQGGVLRTEYEVYCSIPDVLGQYGDPAPGMVTTHDDFAISWSRDEAMRKVVDLLGTTTETEARGLFRLCGQAQWNYERAKKELASGEWKKEVGQVYYRPFDSRWTVYNPNVAVHRRLRASYHFIGSPNIGLCIGKAGQVVGTGQWNLICCTHLPVDFNLFYRGGACNFPLYLYPDDRKLIFPDAKRINCKDTFLKALADKLGLSREKPYGLPSGVAPEDIFNYVYAVFHSPTYRTRYAEFLKIDFPRLPLTSNIKLFRALVGRGADLVALHLLESPKVEDFLTDWSVKGDNTVGKVAYTEKDRRVWINKTQYFGGVPKAVWEFQVGGYQVCQKWLKDRKGRKGCKDRKLTYDDIQHYQKIVVALSETIRLMAEIDKVIDQAGGWPIK